jgi:hypothetical protein
MSSLIPVIVTQLWEIVAFFTRVFSSDNDLYIIRKERCLSGMPFYIPSNVYCCILVLPVAIKATVPVNLLPSNLFLCFKSEGMYKNITSFPYTNLVVFSFFSFRKWNRLFFVSA